MLKLSQTLIVTQTILNLTLRIKIKKHMKYKQFVAFSCSGHSIAPLTYYMQNKIIQKFLSESDYFDLSDTRGLF